MRSAPALWQDRQGGRTDRPPGPAVCVRRRPHPGHVQKGGSPAAPAGNALAAQLQVQTTEGLFRRQHGPDWSVSVLIEWDFVMGNN